MGFHPNDAMRTLKINNGDVQRATDLMLHEQGGHSNPKETPTDGCPVCDEIFLSEQRRIERQILAAGRVRAHNRQVQQHKAQRQAARAAHPPPPYHGGSHHSFHSSHNHAHQHHMETHNTAMSHSMSHNAGGFHSAGGF
ncbi:hypothetical protein Q8F55_008968 [Vanrija albida]|uniref:UBA domain-containing protein n=1 Tax=Vanrija albida TaxID=181172 RepID=A0ABR3PT74_9TREE